MASAKATIDHAEIQRWVEMRRGFPAHVKRTGEGGDPGVLRIDYPGYSGVESLERITWAEWFEWFDRDNLAFLYQDEGGSRFSKLVSRDSVDVSGGGKRASSGGSIVQRVVSAIRGRLSPASASKRSTATKSSKRASRRKATGSGTKAARASRSSKKPRSTSKKAASSRGRSTARQAVSSRTSSKRASSSKAATSRKGAASRKASASKKRTARRPTSK